MIERLQVQLVGGIHLHVFGLVDHLHGLVSFPKGQDRHRPAAAMRIAQPQLNRLQPGEWIHAEVLLQRAAARRQPAQHLLAALEPQLAHHRQQAPQHRALTQQ